MTRREALGVLSLAAVSAAALLVGCDVKESPPAPAQPPQGRAPEAPKEPEAPGAPAAPAGKYKCSVCGYVYDPAKDVPDRGTPPNTPFPNLPADWACPQCGSSKDKFRPVQN